MDSLCLTVSAVAAITPGSSMETQARANERAGVEEGAERLTRPELNRENSRASNERQRMAAAAKPGTTIPPYHHTTTVQPDVYACVVGRVKSNAACPRVRPLSRDETSGWSCLAVQEKRSSFAGDSRQDNMRQETQLHGSVRRY